MMGSPWEGTTLARPAAPHLGLRVQQSWTGGGPARWEAPCSAAWTCSPLRLWADRTGRGPPGWMKLLRSVRTLWSRGAAKLGRWVVASPASWGFSKVGDLLSTLFWTLSASIVSAAAELDRQTDRTVSRVPGQSTVGSEKCACLAAARLLHDDEVHFVKATWPSALCQACKFGSGYGSSCLALGC